MEEILITQSFTDMSQVRTEFQNQVKKLDNLPVPNLINQIVYILKEFRYNGMSIIAILAILLAKFAQIITVKRVEIKEIHSTIFPNLYLIAFLQSGFGKDRLCNEIDKFILKNCFSWLQVKSENFINEKKAAIEAEANKKFPENRQYRLKQQFIAEEVKKIRFLIPEVSDGTREGFYSDAKAFAEAGFGSILVKNSEFGSFLNDATNEQKLFLNQLFEAYSGKVVSKSIKTEVREKNIENVPVNALLFSDPTIFEHNLKNEFKILMETGLGRRSFLVFQANREKFDIELDPEKALQKEEQYFKYLEVLSEEVFSIFKQIEEGAIFKLLPETYTKVLHKYKIQIKEEIEKADNSLFAKEIASRELKAIKLAGLFACLNHPKECEIQPLDMTQAINTVELLSKNFKTFLNYKPRYNDRYDNLFNFFVENEGKEFTKTQLVNKHYNEFCISRDKAKAEFDEYISIVRDIATEKGYFLQEKSINRNSGKTYALIKFGEKEHDEKINFNSLINSPYDEDFPYEL